MINKPKIINVICIIGFILVIFSFVNVFSPGIKKLGILVPAAYGSITALQFISLVGVWYYKQWGVKAFLTAFFAKTLFHLYFNDVGFSFWLFIVFGIVATFIFIRHFKQMNANF